MQKVYYYIGSNNKTGQLELAKIEEAISRFFESFTAYEVIGYWHGQRERSLKIEVITSKPYTELAYVAKTLAKELGQETVAMEVLESNFALVQAQPSPEEDKGVSSHILDVASHIYQPLGSKLK